MLDLIARYHKDINLVEYSQKKEEVNDIVFNLPDGRGKGSFIWEPLSTWEQIFDRDGKSNDWIKAYDKISKKYLNANTGAGNGNSTGNGTDNGTSTVTDVEGNVYRTVTIGTQVWMAENLKTTKYRDGSAIENCIDPQAWIKLEKGAYCSYRNDDKNVAVYGRLYNWFAVNDKRNIAPEGWHIPTEKEWNTLIKYLGGSSKAGLKLKEAGTAHWQAPNEGVTNESGFTTLPAGSLNFQGKFISMGRYGYFWSSGASADNGWYFDMNNNNNEVYSGGIFKMSGFSIRCIKD